MPKESPLTKKPHLSSLHSPRFSNFWTSKHCGSTAAHFLGELTIYIYTQIDINPANIDNCWYFPRDFLAIANATFKCECKRVRDDKNCAVKRWSIIPSTDVIQPLTLTLKMTIAQVVETSVTVNNNSPIRRTTFTRTIKLNLLSKWLLGSNLSHKCLYTSLRKMDNSDNWRWVSWETFRRFKKLSIVSLTFPDVY